MADRGHHERGQHRGRHEHQHRGHYERPHPYDERSRGNQRGNRSSGPPQQLDLYADCLPPQGSSVASSSQPRYFSEVRDHNGESEYFIHRQFQQDSPSLDEACSRPSCKQPRILKWQYSRPLRRFLTRFSACRYDAVKSCANRTQMLEDLLYAPGGNVNEEQFLKMKKLIKLETLAQHVESSVKADVQRQLAIDAFVERLKAMGFTLLPCQQPGVVNYHDQRVQYTNVCKFCRAMGLQPEVGHHWERDAKGRFGMARGCPRMTEEEQLYWQPEEPKVASKVVVPQPQAGEQGQQQPYEEHPIEALGRESHE